MNEYAITTIIPAEHAVTVHPPAGDGWEILQMTQGTSTSGKYGGALVVILWTRKA